MIRLALNNISASLGDGENDYLNLNDGSGSLIVSSLGVAGKFSASVSTSTGLDFALYASNFEVTVNTTGSVVSDSLIVGGAKVILNLEAGNYFRVIAESATLEIAGQSLSSTVQFEQFNYEGNEGNTQRVRILIREASASFGDASSSFAQLNNGSGFFLIEGASGHLIGQVSGEVTFNINNVSFDGNFSFSINRSNQAVNRLIRFGDELINVSLKPGPYFEISGNDVAMTAFEQTITGDFAFSQSDGLTSLRVSNAELNIADGLIKVLIPNGDFIITSEGMFASFAVGVSFGVDGISLADGEVLDLNFSTLY